MGVFTDEFDKAVGYSFGIEIDGVQIKHIQEVTGLKMEQDVIELKQNVAPDGKYSLKKLPGRFKAGELTLTRGLTDDKGFDDWIKASRLGDMSSARKGGHVTVFDYMGKPVKKYTLTNCWPKSLELSSMKAGDTSVLTEKLVVTYESLAPA
jgi:phage tail-like protein